MSDLSLFTKKKKKETQRERGKDEDPLSLTFQE